MMRTKYLWLALILVTVLSACSSYNYYTAGNHDFNIRQYKSFAWAPKVENKTPDTALRDKKSLGARLNYINNNRYYNNTAADAKIRQATVSSLQGQGLTLQESNPDLLVRYATLVDRGSRDRYYRPYYGGPYMWGWGWRFSPYAWGGPWGWGGGYAYPVRETFKEGVLAIELIDAKTNKTIWIGYGAGELSRDPEKSINELPRVVSDILKRLPNNM